MNASNLTTGNMGDKEVLGDMLSSQKFATSNYNTYAGECQNTQLRDEFLNILKEEHCIQSELFNEMQSRGWYQVKQAPQNEVTTVYNKFSGR